MLLGGFGVGKTMLLRRLLRIDAKELADDAAVLLYVDLGRTAVFDTIPSYIAASLREQLLSRYGVDIDDSDSFEAPITTRYDGLRKG